LVKEGGGPLGIAAPVWVVRLGDGPDGWWEESGVGGEDVRGVVHWKALTEEEGGGRREWLAISPFESVALKAKAECCPSRGDGFK